MMSTASLRQLCGRWWSVQHTHNSSRSFDRVLWRSVDHRGTLFLRQARLFGSYQIRNTGKRGPEWSHSKYLKLPNPKVTATCGGAATDQQVVMILLCVVGRSYRFLLQ
eukprot:GHVQ01033938.1.p1 GENE.GHVQ01033938.1~~GHVQ01033938.1.p1  ORF type:complete len:108 (-),score=8.16 GHVQ01033938.1:545-868(-)